MNPLIPPLQSLYYRTFAILVRSLGGIEALTRIDRLARGLGKIRYHAGYYKATKADYLEEIGHCFPLWSSTQDKALLRQFWTEHQRRFLDLFLIPDLSTKSVEKLVRIENRNELDRVNALGKGVILPVPHMGNVRLHHVALALYGYQVSVVSGDWGMEPEYVRRSKLEAESRIHQVGFLSQGSRWMAEALQQGRLLQIASTAEASSQGVWVKLLGRDLYLPTGWMRLARLTEAPVLPTVNYRLRDGRYCLQVLDELPMIWTDDRQLDLSRNGQRLMEVFEPWYRDKPEMIDWMYWLPRVKESMERMKGSASKG
jgi:lauroyl/myristoyl acyltransferase